MPASTCTCQRHWARQEKLERSFGIAKIDRIPLPAGWERQGSGRRLPLFPALAGEDSVPASVESALDMAKRSLVIGPSAREAEIAVELFVPEDIPVVNRDEVAVNFDAFTNQEKAVLVLANRYDGIDLPDEACRLVLLHGVPLGIHLQERFLFDKLSAREALDERIRTRITQGMGRATRNRQDYAAVLFTGQELISFLSREDVRAAMRPELQAELELGLDYADRGIPIADALTAFYEQGSDWQDPESYLRERADELPLRPMAGSASLSDSVPHEIRAWAHAWRDDMEGARDHARAAAQALTGEPVKHYRALWRYLTAAWAQLAAERTGKNRDARLASEARHDAESAFSVLRWYPRFEGQADAPLAGPEYSWRNDRAADWIDRHRRGPRLQKELSKMSEQIGSDEYKSFEHGLKTLGTVLGFESVRPNKTADPDCAWRDGDAAWLLWEAKTMEHADKPVAANDIRQANSHHTWVTRQLGWPEPARSCTVVVCDRDQIHPDAAAVADGTVFLITPAAIRAIAERAVQAATTIGNEAPALDANGLRARIGDLFAEHQLGTEELLAELTTVPVASA